jgi:hypothetical protein
VSLRGAVIGDLTAATKQSLLFQGRASNPPFVLQKKRFASLVPITSGVTQSAARRRNGGVLLPVTWNFKSVAANLTVET